MYVANLVTDQLSGDGFLLQPEQVRKPPPPPPPFPPPGARCDWPTDR